MVIERCKCLINTNMYIQMRNNKFYQYSENIFNKEKKIATFTIEKRMGMYTLSFLLGDRQIKKRVFKINEFLNALCGVYLLYDKDKDILYIIKLDDNTTLTFSTYLEKFERYHYNSISGNMDFVVSLLLYTDLSNKLDMLLLLYCLIINIDEIKLNPNSTNYIGKTVEYYGYNTNEIPYKLDFNLIKYIKEKFQYYGYDINNIDTNYKINFEEKLNTHFILLEEELPLNLNTYYEFFYELFKYLWSLKTIDIGKYTKSQFYENIRTYFKDFICKFIY